MRVKVGWVVLVLVVLEVVVLVEVVLEVVLGVVVVLLRAFRRSLQVGFSVVVGTKFHHFLNKSFKKCLLKFCNTLFFQVKEYYVG